ncbi:MAG: hypothetical protein LBQ54_09115 [Planctomycetaceae bacterium]|nr:hypothetical protein [Planctomycetaceae bacterium]
MPFHRTSQAVGGVVPLADSSKQRERVRGSRDGSPIRGAAAYRWPPEAKSLLQSSRPAQKSLLTRDHSPKTLSCRFLVITISLLVIIIDSLVIIIDLLVVTIDSLVLIINPLVIIIDSLVLTINLNLTHKIKHFPIVVEGVEFL